MKHVMTSCQLARWVILVSLLGLVTACGDDATNPDLPNGQTEADSEGDSTGLDIDPIDTGGEDADDTGTGDSATDGDDDSAEDQGADGDDGGGEDADDSGGDGAGEDGGDATDLADGDDGTDTGDASDASDAQDGTDTTDAADSTDTSDSADGSDVSETGDAGDAADSSDGSDASDTTDTSDTADTTDVTDTSDVVDASDTTDAADTADATDTVDEEVVIPPAISLRFGEITPTTFELYITHDEPIRSWDLAITPGVSTVKMTGIEKGPAFDGSDEFASIQIGESGRTAIWLAGDGLDDPIAAADDVLFLTITYDTSRAAICAAEWNFSDADNVAILPVEVGSTEHPTPGCFFVPGD